MCAAGTHIACDDGVACTTDQCSEAKHACTFTPADADGDGHYDIKCLDKDSKPLGDDCDDNDALRFPGNLEVCDPSKGKDTHDEDCDPTTLAGKDGDSDHDGHIDSHCCNDTACGDDCNDDGKGAMNTYPGANEICDGIDNNCNGLIDESPTNADWYPDLDGDQYGNPSGKKKVSCAPIAGYSTVATDCDDTKAAVNPGNPEICDGIDNDCNGMVDDGINCQPCQCSLPNAGVNCTAGVSICTVGVCNDGYANCDAKQDTGCEADLAAATSCGQCGKICSAIESCVAGSGTHTCQCNAGYARQGTACADIDECATNNGGCGSTTYATCANNVGAPPTCTAIDVCATNNGGCGSATYATCANNVGASPTCTAIGVCATNNGGCGSATYATCANNVGAPPTCTAIDVCATNNGGCGSAVYARCANNVGTPPTCTAIDVCATNNGGCGSSAYWICGNNVGAAPTCTDVDECATNNGGCGSTRYWICGNNMGAAPTCTDVDECATNNGGCSATLSCINNVGAAQSCANIDECAGPNVCTVDYPCQNRDPYYTCRGQFADWPQTDPVFTVNGNGTVTDSRSGLLWQRTLPATYTGCSGNSSVAGDTCTWAEAKTYCTGLSLAGTGWRLPTEAELESIVDFARSNPAIDPTAFPSTPATAFWSSSPYVGSAGSAWYVYFLRGFSDYNDTSATIRVRCVR